MHCADAALRLALELDLFITEAGIDEAIQRHRVGSLRGTGETRRQRHGQ
ncbi:Uncharacterised protein [Bordetella pertussis]|nr:Uncharacterised protein [Bordetella pertussis]CFP65240.1 Uncharacterised protein [Bordetella pertussis]CFW49036.1 Uncharacterised protein [Bordetella pertussis]